MGLRGMGYITSQRPKADPAVHVAQGRASKLPGSWEMLPGSLHANWTPGKHAVIFLHQRSLLSFLLWVMGVGQGQTTFESSSLWKLSLVLGASLDSSYKNLRQMLSSAGSLWTALPPISLPPRLCAFLVSCGMFFFSGLTQQLEVSSPVPPTGLLFFPQYPHTPLGTTLRGWRGNPEESGVWL